MAEIKLDVIGIGALNFDFMFEIDFESGSIHEGGTEFLDPDAEKRVEKKFLRIKKHPLYNGSCKVQYGGAAFGAMRAAHGVSILEKHKKSLRIGYVGVYGKMHSPFSDMLRGMEYNNIDEKIKQSMEFLDSKEGKTFLFADEGQNGVGYFPISSKDGRRFKGRKGDLLTSEIDQGVNKTLQQKIEEKEKELGKNSFSHYLSSAKWIHISSLVEIEQFMWLISRIKDAKDINPELIVSMDPGSTYMYENVDDMKLAYKVCDFIFLSGYEAEYFSSIFKSMESLSDFSSNSVLAFSIEEYIGKNLHCTFIAPDSDVGAYKALRIRNNTAAIEIIQRKAYEVVNDTGSGSAFAGGFILANVNLGLRLEAAIDLGNLAEGLRLVSEEYPYETVNLKTGKEVTLEEVLNDTKKVLDVRTVEAGMPFHIRIFVARPFNDKKYEDFEKAVRSVFEDAPFFFEIRTALDYVHKPGLVANIKEHISTSHGTIAEVSNLNPNVLLEIGAALIGPDSRPLFLVRNKNSEEKVPVDFGDLLRIEYSARGRKTINSKLVKNAMLQVFFAHGNNRGQIINELLLSLVELRKKKKASFLSKTLLEALADREASLSWIKKDNVITTLLQQYTTIEALIKDEKLNEVMETKKAIQLIGVLEGMVRE